MATTREIPETNATAGTDPAGHAASLPDIDALPEADIVIYDGNCNFCKAQVRRLAWFGEGRLSFISLHDERVAERFPDLSHEQLMEQMFVVTPTGERFGGADAVHYLSTRLPWLWFAAPLMYIPFSMPLWKFLYRKIANSRYQIAGSCEGDSCKVHFDK